MAETTPNEVENETSDSEVLGEGGKKALQAEREARTAAEKRLSEVEASLQSALDAHSVKVADLEEQVKSAQGETAAVSLERDRVLVAYKANLPADLVPFLRGESVEELETSAQTLSEHVVREQGVGVPKPDLSQGAKGEAVSASTAEQFAAAIDAALSN